VYRGCQQGLDVRKISSPGGSGEVFFLDIPFYRTCRLTGKERYSTGALSPPPQLFEIGQSLPQMVTAAVSPSPVIDSKSFGLNGILQFSFGTTDALSVRLWILHAQTCC
jgi:hypothetical protein